MLYVIFSGGFLEEWLSRLGGEDVKNIPAPIMTTIIEKTRSLIKDCGKKTTFVVVYEGVAEFPLSVEIKDIVSVKANGVSATYTLSGNTITITSSLSNGDIIEIVLHYYKYSDNELKEFIKNAFNYLSINRYEDFIVDGEDVISPTPSISEENLIANITNVLISDNFRQKRFPDGTSISYPITKDKRTIIEEMIYSFQGNPDYFGEIEL